MAPQLEDEDGIAIPPAPNWYGSALADWGMGSNAIYAYAARNAIVLLRPDGGKGSAPDRPTPQTSSSHSRPHSANVSFAGTLVGHNNRVTALAFARYPGVEHLLLSGSADRTLRLWDVADGRCVRILRATASTSPRWPPRPASRTWRCPGINAVSAWCGGSAVAAGTGRYARWSPWTDPRCCAWRCSRTRAATRWRAGNRAGRWASTCSPATMS